MEEEPTKEDTKDKTLVLVPEKSSEVEHQDAIKDVWLGNFFQAMEKISLLVDEYNYVSMVRQFHF